MPEKRRDKKGRLLRDGEYQRSDGMYEYRFQDSSGKRSSVYSWKLVATDAVPAGKKCKTPLRDMESNIQKDIADGMNIAKSASTFDQCYREWIDGRRGLRESTRMNYERLYRNHIACAIGAKPVSHIRNSDIKKLYVDLLTEGKLGTGTVGNIHMVVNAVFEQLVQDRVLRVNPAHGVMAGVKRDKIGEPPRKRHSLTEKQQEAFVRYVSHTFAYRHWRTFFTFLLGTGCRIGEAIAIRWDDCDFESNLITIDHAAIHLWSRESRSKILISKPKTEAGIRVIPMLEDVKRTLLQERARQMRDGFHNITIDGYTNFIFASRRGRLLSPNTVDRAIDKIVETYNIEETDAAYADGREPELLPHFSAHTFRHTFCTRYCENENDLKTIQEIMGHRSITTTMDIYNESTNQRKLSSFERLNGKITVC